VRIQYSILSKAKAGKIFSFVATEGFLKMARNRSITKLLLYILLGAICGGLVGELVGIIFGYFIPNSMVEKFFLETFLYEFPPATLPLIVFSVTFGFTLKVNVISVLGIGFATYYYRWY